jgi:serine/threonine protein kinase/Flp pilus assembly protein TadD
VTTGTALIGSTILHYHIIERLGGGGMGEVYLAEDQRLGRRVALKFLASHVSGDGEARERLIREAQAAALLRSPHIAVTYDLIEHDDALFIAMEYVEGELLSARVARGPLAVADALDVALQLTDALDEAHSRGIVHRDIKSANVMITSRQLVKVLDFGLAKFLTAPKPEEIQTLAGMTMPGLVLGTLNYMAPEQLSGGVVDHRADLFSTGVVLYEMLAARLPFAGATFPEIADRILNQEPDAIARYNYSVSIEVEAIIRKALQKRPDFRYQTARDFYIDLLNARRQAIAGDSSHRGSNAWLGPIDFADAASPMPMRPASPPRPAATGLVAVLNFTNITGNPADDWVGQGIAESLTADLMRIKTLSVVPREQIFDLQRNLTSHGRPVDERQAIELGRRLGAGRVVSGAYQRLGPRIRITAQAIEVGTGGLLATVKLDGSLDELFELQDRLVIELMERGLQQQVRQSDVVALAGGGTQSMEAFEAYSRGMLNLRLAERDSVDRAIALLEEAMRRDPDFVEAAVALGGALQLKGSFLSMPDLVRRSLDLLTTAVAQRPDFADAHARLGATLLDLGRADEAIASLREAIRLQPDHSAAHSNLARAYWLGKANVDEAIDAFRETLRLNPSGGYAYLQLALLYALRGDSEEAAEIAERAIALQEQAMSGTAGLLIVGAHTRLGYARYRQGRLDEAIQEYRRELEFVGAGNHVLRERTTIELNQKLGAAYRRQGDLNRAAFHEDLAIKAFNARLASGGDDPYTRYYMATLHALRGEAGIARQHLELPLRELAAFTRWRLPKDPDFDPVRRHSLFADLG